MMHRLLAIFALLAVGCSQEHSRAEPLKDQEAQIVSQTSTISEDLEMVGKLMESEIALREKAFDGWMKARNGQDTDKEAAEYEVIRKAHNDLVTQWRKAQGK